MLSPARTIDLATLQWVFFIRGHDALAAAISPALTTSIDNHAPHAALLILSEAPNDSSDLPRGYVDLELGGTQPVLPEIAAHNAGTDRTPSSHRPVLTPSSR